MHIRHILFDLDGTLLPMNQDEFVTFYMPLLAKKYLSEGISFDPKAFIAYRSTGPSTCTPLCFHNTAEQLRSIGQS